MMDTVAIVGAGLAGAKTAEGLRAGGFEGRVILLGAEPHRPYERPPLSKGYLLGAQELDKAFVHPAAWYDEQQVELRLGSAVRSIDLGAHSLATETGVLEFDRLVLATGATPRRLPATEAGGVPVCSLRTIEDSRTVKAALRPGHRLVIVGGGWIGLEVAAAARTAGCEVVVLEALDLPLLRVLGPEVAEVFRALHEEHGVDVRTNATLTSVESRSGRAVVHLADGPSLTADLLLVGVGVAPNTELAEGAGLAVDNGIVVDEHLRASHPDVLAVGDVANAYHPRLGRRLRVEHWDNAIAQGLMAARTLLGDDEPLARLPYFFTDQYDLGIEYVGSIGPDGYDEVVLRGDVPGRLFTAFWLHGGKVVAGMHANDWDAIESIRRLVEAGQVDTGRLRDPDVGLQDLLR